MDSLTGDFATRVLNMPDILQVLFEVTDSRELARCACVCRRWSSLALDSLWKNLPSIMPLFKLLFAPDWIVWRPYRDNEEVSLCVGPIISHRLTERTSG